MEVDNPRRPLKDFARGNTPASQPGPSSSSRGKQPENPKRTLRSAMAGSSSTTSRAVYEDGISDVGSEDAYVQGETEESEDDYRSGED